MIRLFRLFALVAVLFPVVGQTAPPTVEPAPASVSVDLQRRDTGTFYIPGAIQGYGEVDFLVDTGSTFLVINEAILTDLAEAGTASFSHELHGSMADGSDRVVPIYRLAGLRLGAACWIPDVEAAVLPGRARPILGMNILVRLAPFTFSTEPPQLGLNRCMGLPQVEIAELTATPPSRTAAP
jgi:clan AA aspartic protease (TIGR02281 family)